MSTVPTIFPPDIRRYLADFVARKRKVALVKAIGIALAAGLVGMLLCCGADRLQPLPRTLRVLLLLADVVTMLVLVVRPLMTAFLGRVDWVTAAEEVEGQNSAFAQRLQTITSQLLSPVSQRGSQQILDHLVGEVTDQAHGHDARRLVPWRWARRPWAVAAGVVAMALGLAFIPWLDLPQLIHRFVVPLADVAPVTTTKITLIQPTEHQIGVFQGEPLNIHAKAEALGDEPLYLYVSNDGKNWSSQSMEQTLQGFYRLSLASVDRDLSFYLKGGDAKTAIYDVRVLRRPAISEFRVHYTYPAYTGLEARTVSNTDGLIEAPVGSEASIVIVATEPLAEASWLINGQKQLDTAPTVEATSRQLKLTVDHDAAVELSMTSLRGVKGSGPATMAIHAIADQPPIVRLIQPTGDLRLSPRDVVDVAYQALDQYGIATLLLHCHINGTRESDLPIRVRGDARLQEGSIPLDLATLDVKVGDVVTIQLRGDDVAGLKQLSASRSILVVPRAIDINTHQRIVELKAAASLADNWVADVDAARRSADESRQYAEPEADKRTDALASTARYLGSGWETSMLLRQSLLRVLGHSASPAMSDGVANLVDAVTLRGGALGRVAASLTGLKPVDDTGMNALNDASAAAHELARQLHSFADGESASAILIDRADLNLSSTQASSEPDKPHHQQAMQRAREEIAGEVKDMGLDPAAGNLDSLLQDRANAEQQWLANQQPVDFVSAANQWVDALRQPKSATTDLEPRLAAAADVEAVRPDSDFIAARDLQLAACAAAAVAEAVLSTGVVSAPPAWVVEALGQYPSALSALRVEHALTREPAGAHAADQIQQIHTAATAARAKMNRWAHPQEMDASQPTTGPTAAELAMAADAETAKHDYTEAAALDAKLRAATQPANTAAPMIALPREKIDRKMSELQQLDQIAAAQATVQKETEEAEPHSGIDAPDGLADKQQAIADDIDKARHDADPEAAQSADDSRHNATGAIQGAQEQLAQLPQQMDAAQNAAEAARQANERLAAAQNNARGAEPGGQAAANLAADQARQEAAAAQQRLADAVRPLSPDAMQQLADGLRKFSPETTDATAAMDNQLIPAMNGMDQALQASAAGGDSGAVGRSAAQSLAAISAVQTALREAQSQITQRDPLVAARWFAQAAKQALSNHPPNYKSAMMQQQQTAQALSEAWNQTAHGLARQRLSQIPGLATIYEPNLNGDAPGLGTAESPLLSIPSLREWGRLRPLDQQSLNSSLHDTDPAGYEESLKLYFEAMNKPRDGK